MAAELTDEREALTAAYMAFCKDRAPDHNEVGFAYFKAAWEARAALATQQATQGAEPGAWAHEDDPSRVISAIQKAQALRDGGASSSSVRPYSVALYTAPPPTAEVEKKAARYDWLRANYAPPSYGDGWDTMDNAIASGGAAMDQAIDAALKSDQAHAGKDSDKPSTL